MHVLCRWEPENSKLFPKTTQIVKDSKAPSLEVFFARQPAGTGIQPHTDNANFVMTGHLALVVPEGNCWIKVRPRHIHGSSSLSSQQPRCWLGHCALQYGAASEPACMWHVAVG